MSSHAKASTAGSTQRQAGRLGRFFRGADATRGASYASKGSGAPKARRLVLPIGVLAAILAVFFLAIPAGAAVHQFETSFGASGSGSGQFSTNKGIAVDQSDGSVYVADSGNYRVQKFDAAGNFVLMFGKGVDQTNPGDICTAASGDTCQAGTQGSGGSGFDTNNGFSNPSFVAVDPNNGDVYVADLGTNVVDKFSSSGAFLSSNNGSGSGSSFGSIAGIAVDPSRNLWVYDESAQMRKFDNTGAFLTQWNSGFGVTGVGIAVDSSQNLYVVRGFPAVQKFSSTGTNLGELDGSGTATALGIDPSTDELYVGATNKVNHFAGNCSPPCTATESFGTGDITNAAGVAVRSSTGSVYVSDRGKPGVEIFKAIILPDVVSGSASNVAQTGATLNGTVNPNGVALTECKFEYGTTTGYGQSIPCAESLGAIGTGSSPVPVHADVSGLTLGTTYHFRLKATNANGTVNGSDASLNTLSPPLVKEERAESVTFTEAVLKAKINSKGFATTYRFQWGTTASYGQETEAKPAGSDAADHTFSLFLEDLQPGTTYHYRVVATNSVGTTEGPDRTITTFEHSAPDTDCTNQDFRNGSAANLPDCRGYEMVTPIEKGGFDIKPWEDSLNRAVGVDQAALDGDSMAFTSHGSFGDAASNLASNQYIASRGAGGWSTHSLNPPHENNALLFFDFGNVPGRYGAFTEDLSLGFLYDNAKPPLTEEALGGGYYNDYLWHRDGESLEALTTQMFSPGEEVDLGGMGLRGYSADGSHVLFQATLPLTSDAKPGSSRQLYVYHDGELELVSVLPNGEAAQNAAAGQANFSEGRELGETRHAISDDGSRVFWMTTPGGADQIGKIYARIDGETTVKVSESVSATNNATYWAAAADGSQAIFSAGTNLYRFDVDTETPTLIAGQVSEFFGVFGVSEDASSVYLLSKEVLAAGAVAGKPNLYLDREGAKTFIATLAAGDEDGPGQTAENGARFGGSVLHDFSQVTPDGDHVVFNSRASLTDYDNTSLKTGEPAIEIYDYDATAQQLSCISCNPSGGRPATGYLPTPYESDEQQEGAGGGLSGGGAPFDVQAAAWLPTPRRATHIPRMVQDDGKRVFFNAFDALVPEDTNGVQDVYQWEAQGTGSCVKAGGCVSLISTGESPIKSTFVDASGGGRDVFFKTDSSIDPEDPGLVDIYDARIGGGISHPPSPPDCFGDSCQSPPAAPNDPTPASAGFRGAGNPTPAKPRRSCRGRKRQAKHKRGKAGRAKHSKANKRCKRNNGRAGR